MFSSSKVLARSASRAEVRSRRTSVSSFRRSSRSNLNAFAAGPRWRFDSLFPSRIAAMRSTGWLGSLDVAALSGITGMRSTGWLDSLDCLFPVDRRNSLLRMPMSS